MPARGVIGEEDARQVLSLGRTAVLGTGDPQGKGNAVVLCQRLLRGALLPPACPPPAVPCRREPAHTAPPCILPGRPGSMKDTSLCLPAQPQHSAHPSTGQDAARPPLTAKTPALQDKGIRKAGSCPGCSETVTQAAQSGHQILQTLGLLCPTT